MTDTTSAPTACALTACALTGRPLRPREVVRLGTLRPGIAERIRRDHPGLADDAPIDTEEAHRWRQRYIEELLLAEHGELSTLDREVTASIARQDTIATDTEREFEGARTLGQRLSDHLASFGGSWRFLIAFALLMAGWIALNAARGGEAFDPYPFILLNLILSTLAAIQAPIIMMSQNRQETKDRVRSLNDYRVNLKAELEIHHLHEKLDHLMTRQWERLAEIQRLQIELMQETRGAPR